MGDWTIRQGPTAGWGRQWLLCLMLWGKEGMAMDFIMSLWLKCAEPHVRQAPEAVAVEPYGGRRAGNRGH